MNYGQTLGGRESGRSCRTRGQTTFCRDCPALRGSDGNVAIENRHFQWQNTV